MSRRLKSEHERQDLRPWWRRSCLVTPAHSADKDDKEEFPEVKEILLVLRMPKSFYDEQTERVNKGQMRCFAAVVVYSKDAPGRIGQYVDNQFIHSYKEYFGDVYVANKIPQ